MITGHEVWNQSVSQDMGVRKIGEKEVFTFLHMRNNFYEILEDTVQRFPDKTAFCDNWSRSYTYREFQILVDSMAATLEALGVRKGSHVGLLLHNSIEFCASFYAVCKLGAVTVPFPSKYRRTEIRSLIDKADLSYLLCAEKFREWVCDYEQKGIFICYSENEEEGFGFRHLELKEGKPGGGRGELTDEVILMFTSGTTSESKGVVLKNYNIIHAVIIYQRLCQVTSEDKTIIPVPIYHITGLIALLGLFVYTGGTVYLYRRYDARQILQCIKENNITFMHGSPTVFGLLMDFKEAYPKLPSIRTLLCGSSYMPVEKMKQLHGWMPSMKLMTVFGMTETSSPGTLFPYDAATSIYPSSSGRPIPGMELKIVDENGKEVETGQVGIVFVRGANVLEYYYNMQTDLITEDGWLNTGDMGYVNEDSYVFFVDRKKDMINRGGEKIWCTDVEDELLALEGIRDAAVVGIPSEKYGEVAAAIVVCEKGCFEKEEDIRQALGQKMARYKIPERILFVEEIPKTPGLKVDKKYIRTLFK
ncbi:MAG: acyl--CoA ligase [Lachnospiraceae bacterium]|nr:acyl--CoA ligase [Lachnospiraceae bacterium]